MGIHKFSLQTGKESLIKITSIIREALAKSGVRSGVCAVFCPHTTAGITINENADPDVVRDILFGLDQVFPDRAEFVHYEGNSAAHLKSSAFGASQTVIIENGALLLGQWQDVYFCEFDGPRRREFYVKIIQG